MSKEEEKDKKPVEQKPVEQPVVDAIVQNDEVL